MALAQVLLQAFGLIAALGLPVGVLLTALLLEEDRHLAWSGIGLGSLAGAMVTVELARRSSANTTEGKHQEIDPSGVSQFSATAFEALPLQVITVLLFALRLDGGVHVPACCFVYLGYAGGAVLVLGRRGKALTPGDRLYLMWGWVPIVVIGGPLFIRVWKATSLI
jgi:hypothetical protein